MVILIIILIFFYFLINFFPQKEFAGKLNPANSNSFNAPLKKLFSDEVLNDFNYEGINTKKSFKNLKITNLLFGKFVIVNLKKFK